MRLRKTLFVLLLGTILASAGTYAMPKPQGTCPNVNCDLAVCNANGQYAYIAVVEVGWESNIGRGRCPQFCAFHSCIDSSNTSFYFVDHQNTVYEVKHIHTAKEKARIRQHFIIHENDSTESLVAYAKSLIRGDETLSTMTPNAYNAMMKKERKALVESGELSCKANGK